MARRWNGRGHTECLKHEGQQRQALEDNRVSSGVEPIFGHWCLHFSLFPTRRLGEEKEPRMGSEGGRERSSSA